MMDHRQIEEENWPERYVLRQLSAEQAERFEDHYLDCPQCLEQLELTQQLNEGMREVVAEDGAKWVLGASLLRGWLRSRGLFRAALGLGFAALLATSLWWLQERGERRLLSTQLEQALAPRINMPVVSLGLERSASSGASRVVQLPSEPGWIVLSAELPPSDYSQIHASLQRRDQPPLWQGIGSLAPSGQLTLGLHSSKLEPGEHVLVLEGVVPDEPPVPLGRYAFRVTQQ